MKKLVLCLSISLMLLWLTGCEEEPVSKTTYALGTIISLEITSGGSQDTIDTLIQEINRIEGRLSSNIEGSEISAINAKAGIEPVKVSQETYDLIEKSIAYSHLSQGAFDVSLGPIIDLWGIGTDEAAVPDQEMLENALSHVGYEGIQLLEDNQVYIESGMSLDLGGIAKGYVADALVAIAKEAGVKSAIFNLGGNVILIGHKVDGQPYHVGVQNPFDDRNAYFAYVTVSDKTVVTSGNYERYFEVDGHRYHHLIDGTTGYPSEKGISGVTIIANGSVDADALSTAVFVLGEEAGIDLINSIEGVECLVIRDDYQVAVSQGMSDLLTITDHNFTIK